MSHEFWIMILVASQSVSFLYLIFLDVRTCRLRKWLIASLEIMKKNTDTIGVMVEKNSEIKDCVGSFTDTVKQCTNEIRHVTEAIKESRTGVW